MIILYVFGRGEPRWSVFRTAGVWLLIAFVRLGHAIRPWSALFLVGGGEVMGYPGVTWTMQLA